MDARAMVLSATSDMDKQFAQALSSLKLDLTGTLVRRVSVDGTPLRTVFIAPKAYLSSSLRCGLYLSVGGLPSDVDWLVYRFFWL